MLRMLQSGAIFLAFAAAPPVVAEGIRYELFPERDVGGAASYRTANAYVVDKKENQFWVCSARYNHRDLSANNGACVKPDATVGRHSLNEKYVAHAVTGSGRSTRSCRCSGLSIPTAATFNFARSVTPGYA